MKTSLVSSAVSSASVKADRPQPLKSVTVYWRGRKMVLMQRPQRRLSLLLCKMLRRSMQNLFGTLLRKLPGAAKRILSAGALAAAALAAATTATATVYAANSVAVTIPDTTLPTDYSVKYGQVGVTTTGSQMAVNIGTDKAIINWGSFSIGSAAGVNFNFTQANAGSSVLNRVIGNDPSVIMGSLTSNGKVFLINAAGILVGKTATINLPSFIASTLNISDSNFLAGNLMFNGTPGATAGVKIEKNGSITTPEGGSVYLLGATVENEGIITAPGGEILLAAGSSVQLVDTGTPGVTVNVTGAEGKVTNLGQIMAAAGTIGIGAALIDNSGVINASSVTKVGGRIFLRASQNLTTGATSSINADGTVGGNVVLYSDQSANIDGDVSALGNVDGKGGKGGFVDTSGKSTLSVKYVPRVGPGGEWYIDPFDITIVGDDSLTQDGITLNGGAITASASSAGSIIRVGTINTQLNLGVNVTVSTGTGGTADGDITVNAGADIVKSSGVASSLTLQAAGDIKISSGASIKDNSSGGALSLVLNAGNGTGEIENEGVITMRGGSMQALGESFKNGGTLTLGGGTLTSSSDLLNVTNGTIAGTGTIDLGGTHTLINQSGIAGSGQGGVIIGPDASHTGTLTVNGNYEQSSTGVLQVKVGKGAGGTGPLVSDKLVVTGNVTLAGNLKINGMPDYVPQEGDKIAVLNYAGSTRVGSFAAQTGSLTTMFINYLLPLTGSGHDISAGYAPAVSNYFSGAAGTLNWDTAANWSGNNIPVSSASVYVDVGSTYSVMHATAVDSAIQALTIASGKLEVSGGSLTVNGAMSGDGTLVISNTGSVVSQSESSIGNLQLQDTGTLTANNNFTTSNLTMSGGGITNVANTLFTVDGALSQNGGSIALLGHGSFRQGSGNLWVGDISAIGSLTLTATSGAISQMAETSLTANSLSASATGGITLNNTGNNVQYFGAQNNSHDGIVSSGNITFKNSDTRSLSLGSLGNSNGNITVTTAGQMVAPSDNSISAGGTVDFTSVGSMLISTGSITAHDINLTTTVGGNGTDNIVLHSLLTAVGTLKLASAGGIEEQSGGIVAGTVDATAGNGRIWLDQVKTNHIGTFKGNVSGTGDYGGIKVSNTGNLILGNVTASGAIEINTVGTLTVGTGTGTATTTVAAQAITLTTKAVGTQIHTESEGNGEGGGNPLPVNADMAINGSLTATGESGVNLTSDGKITQATGDGTGIVASNLFASAVGGITLNSEHNSVGEFNAFNGSSSNFEAVVSGDIALKNASSTLTLDAIVRNDAIGGNVTISNTGDIIGVPIPGEGYVLGGTTANNKVTLTSTGGNVTLAVVTAANLEVNAAGSISQEMTPTDILTISGNMTATANTGIALNNNNATGLNHIANLSAHNNGSGNITVVNQSTGDVSNKLIAITNSGGNIFIDNIGAMETVGQISAPAGSVTLATHSPLTIGAGGINAGTGVNLSAGNGTSITDSVVINGAIHNVLGATTLAGNVVHLNAPIFGPTPVFNSPNLPDIGAGFALNPVTVIPSVTVTPPVTTTNTVDQNIVTTTDRASGDVNVFIPTTVTTTDTTLSTSRATDQTVGGNAGEFGGNSSGSSKDDSKESSTAKPNKPLPVCT